MPTRATLEFAMPLCCSRCTAWSLEYQECTVLDCEVVKDFAEQSRNQFCPLTRHSELIKTLLKKIRDLREENTRLLKTTAPLVMANTELELENKKLKSYHQESDLDHCGYNFQIAERDHAIESLKAENSRLRQIVDDKNDKPHQDKKEIDPIYKEQIFNL